MIIDDDYENMTNEERRKEILFEQYFSCPSNIDMEKRDYILNCLSKTAMLHASNIIEMSIKDYRDCILINGSYSKIGANFSLRGELYEEDNKLSFALESENIKTHETLYSLEEFERKGEVVEHSIVVEEGMREQIKEIPINELNFVSNKKAKIK